MIFILVFAIDMTLAKIAVKKMPFFVLIIRTKLDIQLPRLKSTFGSCGGMQRKCDLRTTPRLL